MKRGAAEISSGTAPSATPSLTHSGKGGEAEAEAALFGEAMQQVDMKKLMDEQGPVVKCVMLRACGVAEQLQVDMSPKLQETQKLLGGGATFLGQWEDLEVILMINADQEEDPPADKRNTHKLQPPFHSAVVTGDILLTRSDDNGQPKDFTLDEYDAFTKLDIKEWEPAELSEEDGEDDDEDDEDDDDEEEDEEFSGEDDEDDEDDDEDVLQVLEVLRARLKEGYVREYGREPTPEELEELMGSLTGKLDALQEGDEEEGEEEEEA